MDVTRDEQLVKIDNEIRMIEDVLKDFENGLLQYSPTITRPVLQNNLPAILEHLKIKRTRLTFEKYVDEYEIDITNYQV